MCFGARRIVLLLALIALWTGDASADPRRLVIASEGARPPFNYLDQNNELAGFEIDLGREICARIAAQCSFVAQDWDGLIPGLLSRQYDAVMAAMEITDERRAKIAFSTPYFRSPAAFVVETSSALSDASPATLAGRTIGVEDQSASQSLFEEAFKAANPKTYATLEDAMLDLAENKIDAVLADKLALAEFLKTRKEGQCCRFLADAPRDPAIFGDGIGVGLRKDDDELRKAVDGALQAMMTDGSYDRIIGKYFDFPIR